MKKSCSTAALAALMAASLLAGTAGNAPAATTFKDFTVTSWTCAGNANGVWSQNCYQVADYFCKKQGYDGQVTFRFSKTNGKVSWCSRIVCKKS